MTPVLAVTWLAVTGAKATQVISSVSQIRAAPPTKAGADALLWSRHHKDSRAECSMGMWSSRGNTCVGHWRGLVGSHVVTRPGAVRSMWH